MKFSRALLLTTLLMASGLNAQTASQNPGTGSPAIAISDGIQAGEGSIVGTVVDEEFRFPIEGATVEVLGTGKSAITGKDGQYRIPSLPKGFYQVQATLKPDYNYVTKNNVPVENGKEEPLFFELKRTSDIPPDFVPVEKQPVPTANPGPRYPESAKKDSVEGTIWVRLMVNEEGGVGLARVMSIRCTRPGVEVNAPTVDSLEKENLSKATYQAIVDLVSETTIAAKEWKFTPAMLSGKPVKVWVAIPFKYKLNPADDMKGSSKKETQKTKK